MCVCVQEARAALAWVRGGVAGAGAGGARLQEELSALPVPEPALHSPLALIKEMRMTLYCYIVVQLPHVCVLSVV